MDTLLAWFKAQSPRDQRVAAGAAVILVILLVCGIFIPLDGSVSRAHARVQRKQADLAWMRSVAPGSRTSGSAILDRVGQYSA